MTDSICSGIAGEHFVCAELSRRGYLASLTLRNTRGIDILASSADASRQVGIQVKTMRHGHGERRWLLNKKADDFAANNLFYVFVNLPDAGLPSFYVVPSNVVADYVKQLHADWLAMSRTHKENSMREFRDPEGVYLDRWDLLRLDAREEQP